MRSQCGQHQWGESSPALFRMVHRGTQHPATVLDTDIQSGSSQKTWL